jgi:hypothetical protein
MYNMRLLNTTRLILALVISLLCLVGVNLDLRPAMAETLKQKLERIDRQALENEARLDEQLRQVERQFQDKKVQAELKQQNAQVIAQFKEILNDNKKYKEILENPNVPQQVKDVFRRARTNPEVINKFVEQQNNPRYLAQKQRLEIRKQRDEARRQAINENNRRLLKK